MRSRNEQLPARDHCGLESTCPCATQICAKNAGLAPGTACHANADCEYAHACVDPADISTS